MVNYLPPRRSKMLSDWLRSVGPEDWHRFATQWNWDLGEDYLRWIIQQKDCDKATALHIFWHGEPEYFYRSGATNRDNLKSHIKYVNYDGYDLLVDIIARWKEGYYTRSEFRYPYGRYEQINYNHKHYEQTSKHSAVHPALSIPLEMTKSISGCDIDPGDFEEGIPSFICDATRDEPYDNLSY